MKVRRSDSIPVTTATIVEETQPATDHANAVQISNGFDLTGNWSMFSYLFLILSGVLAVMAALWLLPRMRVRAKSEVTDHVLVSEQTSVPMFVTIELLVTGHKTNNGSALRLVFFETGACIKLLPAESRSRVVAPTGLDMPGDLGPGSCTNVPPNWFRDREPAGTAGAAKKRVLS
jgi:hypothetical protein